MKYFRFGERTGKRSEISPQRPTLHVTRVPLSVPQTTFFPFFISASERSSSPQWSDCATIFPLRRSTTLKTKTKKMLNNNNINNEETSH